ncbi:MAG TPA: hypothetical protein VHZ24_07575 [Pirellulales bacterium]|jgi:hypothetical protein|nr:hypothetical protein [Pirellulales bacterium]
MSIPVGPQYPKEEFSARGSEIYQRRVAPTLRTSDTDRFVAIDIDSEDFEIAEVLLDAAERLRERRPDAQIWGERVGHPAVVRIGRVR